MKFNLYPFNFYILLGSCIVVIFFLFVVLSHLSKLSSSLQKENEVIQRCERQKTLLNIKQNVLLENHAETHKNDKYYKVLLPFLLAIVTTYKKDSESKGIKGYKKATNEVLMKNVRRTEISNFLKSLR